MLLFKCLSDSDVWSGLFSGIIAAAISSVVIVIGYYLQGKQFNKQLKAQHDSNCETMQSQMDATKKQLIFAGRQTILDITLKKAEECNSYWGRYSSHNIDGLVSSMVIAGEIAGAYLDMLGNEYLNIAEERAKIGYVFWKTLNTDLRGFFVTVCIDRAYRYGKKTIFGDQVYSIISWVESSMEQRKQINETLLQSLKQWHDEKEYK